MALEAHGRRAARFLTSARGRANAPWSPMKTSTFFTAGS
jgi:hypothetical protein